MSLLSAVVKGVTGEFVRVLRHVSVMAGKTRIKVSVSLGKENVCRNKRFGC